MPSRASNAVLTVDSREARDIEISLRDWAGEGLCRNLGRESQGALRCRHPRRRVTEYSEAPEFYFEGRGVLDAPPSRGMTAGGEFAGTTSQRAAPTLFRNPVRSSVTWST